MNKRILLLTITACLFLAGCAQKGVLQPIGQSLPASAAAGGAVSSEVTESSPVSIGSDTSLSSEQLKSILAKYTTKQIVFIQSVALDGKQNAAFAVAGDEAWYVTAAGAQKLKDNITVRPDNPSQVPVLWSVDGVDIFKCENAPGGSSSVSYAWYVKTGKPVELPYTGMNLSYLGNGQFTTIGDTFDMNFTDGVGAGHTYKVYYLYWAGDGLKEYGGLKITQQQLLKVKGAQAVINTLTQSGHTIDGIYYRANNLININYHSGTEQNAIYDNVTLIYKDNTATPELAYAGTKGSNMENFNAKDLGDFSYGGSYQAALFPEIATYPAEFPVN